MRATIKIYGGLRFQVFEETALPSIAEQADAKLFMADQIGTEVERILVEYEGRWSKIEVEIVP